jgi:hypothetical protein
MNGLEGFIAELLRRGPWTGLRFLVEVTAQMEVKRFQPRLSERPENWD